MRKGERDRGSMSTCVGEEGAGEEGRETGVGGGSTCRPYTVCAVYVGL